MDTIIIVLLVVLIALAISLLIYELAKKKKGGVSTPNLDAQDIDREIAKTVKLALKDETVESAKNLNHFQTEITEAFQKRMDALNKQLDDKIVQLDKKVDEKLKEGFKNTNESMSQVRERLKAIDVAQKQMEGLGKEVISLKNVLEGNQTRGQYGEYQLSMVLHNVFGDTVGCYEEQYTMKKVKDGDDVRADAVVFVPEPYKLIAIDSKFPFKDYARIFDTEDAAIKESLKKDFAAAVKKHITAIKEKYIVEGKTAPEALMFIPNDGVFAFIHHDLQDVVEYAREKRVVLTSPSTLPMILFTFNMVRIDAERAKNAKEISKNLSRLSKDFEMFGREWNTFSNQLATASKSREKLDSRVSKITTKFDSINSSTGEIEEKEEPAEITTQEQD